MTIVRDHKERPREDTRSFGPERNIERQSECLNDTKRRGLRYVDKAGNKFCVMVTALSVKGRNLHQGEIVEDSALEELKELLLLSGMIRRAEELSLSKSTPVAA